MRDKDLPPALEQVVSYLHDELDACSKNEGGFEYGLALQHIAYTNADVKGFWLDLDPKDSNVFNSKCMLIVTELAEAVEAMRKPDLAPDRDLVDITNAQVELADALIRLLDLYEAVFPSEVCLTIFQVAEQKMRVNLDRPPKHGKRS